MATAGCKRKSTKENTPAKTPRLDVGLPSQEKTVPWIWWTKKRTGYGKWCIFRHESGIDELWKDVCETIESTEACGAKVSTKYPKNDLRDTDHKQGNLSDVHVVIVYTEKEHIKTVAKKLIYTVRQKMRYKPNEATHQGDYTSEERIILYTGWNRGNTFFLDPATKREEQIPLPTFEKEKANKMSMNYWTS